MTYPPNDSPEQWQPPSHQPPRDPYSQPSVPGHDFQPPVSGPPPQYPSNPEMYPPSYQPGYAQTSGPAGYGPPQYPPSGYGQPPPPPPPRGGMSSGAVIGLIIGAVAVIALLAVGFIMVVNNNDSSPTAISSSAPATEPGSVEPQTSGEPSLDPNAPISGDGMYIVGQDIESGDYRTTVPEDSILCYWERLSATTGEFEDIIANGVADAGEHVTVTIESDDKAFSTDGCGAWQKA